MTIDEVFQGLASLKRWVPYKMVYNAKREKFDKIPAKSEQSNLSTSNPDHWQTLMDACETVSTNYGLSGVGFVMTEGIHIEGYTLAGFDFDDVVEDFIAPFMSYAELSPSKNGVRMFAWVPTAWATQYQDTLNTHPPGCEHCEVYIGSAPRFLTVTFDATQLEDISILTSQDLSAIESWGMHLYEEPTKEALPASVDVVGTPINLSKSKFKLTAEHRKLLNGVRGIDRSEVIMSFGINVLDSGASQEDLLATLVHTPTLWQYCMDHRNNNEEKAFQFAKEEVTKAYSKSQPGKKEALIGMVKKYQVIPDQPKKDDLNFPVELFDNAPGIVGEIARWIMKASYTPRKEYAYACALSMTSCMIGPYCTHGSRNGKMNMYFTLVGGTGTGKNEAIDVMGLLLNSTDAKDCMIDFPASEAGLRRQLNLTPNLLLRVDELAHKLEGMKDNSNGSSMGRAILEAYNAARMPAKVYADVKNSLPAVENPYVQILGGTTDKVWDVVKNSHVEDGTLNRFLFVYLKNDPEYSFNPEPDAEIDKAFKDRINTFCRAGKMADLIGDMPGFGRKAVYSKEVKDAVIALDRGIWDYQKEEFGNLYSRFVHNTTKIASILAVGDGRLTVTIRDFEQARKFVRWSVTNTVKKITTHMAGSNYEKLGKRLLNRLAQCGGKLTMREAYKFLHITQREMNDLTYTLIMSGEIDMDKASEDSQEYITLL